MIIISKNANSISRWEGLFSYCRLVTTIIVSIQPESFCKNQNHFAETRIVQRIAESAVIIIVSWSNCFKDSFRWGSFHVKRKFLVIKQRIFLRFLPISDFSSTSRQIRMQSFDFTRNFTSKNVFLHIFCNFNLSATK